MYKNLSKLLNIVLVCTTDGQKVPIVPTFLKWWNIEDYQQFSLKQCYITQVGWIAAPTHTGQYYELLILADHL